MSLENVKLHLVETIDDVIMFNNWFTSIDDQPIAVDTEGTGLSPERDHVRLVQVGDNVHGWAMDWSRWSGAFVDIMKMFFKHRQSPVIMHNAKFDYAFLTKAGVKLERGRIEDTRVMAHILDPTFSTALKKLAGRHVDPQAAALQDTLGAALSSGSGGWTWETVPCDYEPYWTYGALDTVLTRRLSDVIRPQVMSVAPKAFEIENSVAWVAEAMERYGAHVDVQYAVDNSRKFVEYCEQVDRWCKAEYNVKPGSNAAIVRILTDAGFEFTKATKSGAVSLDGEVLENIDHPLAKAVLQRRRLQKLASTYLQFYIENADSDSLIHPSINTLGARTSRMSMNDPNLQNLPRASENNPAARVVRNCIDARPGHTLLFSDFDQIEMRLLATFSRDPGLIAAFLDPEDFFVTIARNIFNAPDLIKSDPRRQPTKNSMYAKIYGAGIAKQAITAGVSYEQMKFVNDALNAAYPHIEGYSRAVYGEAMRMKSLTGNGYALCPITGRRHPADPGKEYALVNYLIQGAAATVFKMKLLELDAAGLGQWMVAPVHDEIILDVPNEDVRDVVHTLRQVMNDTEMFAVPITAGISHGKRWGEKVEWVDNDISGVY